MRAFLFVCMCLCVTIGDACVGRLDGGSDLRRGHLWGKGGLWGRNVVIDVVGS